jgi:hypothetical protein
LAGLWAARREPEELRAGIGEIGCLVAFAVSKECCWLI